MLSIRIQNVNLNSHTRSSIQPLRSRLKAATKLAILEAAEEIFADQGIHAARMEDIATRAGTAVGTIYNYFGDRRELVDTLCTTRREELLARIDHAISGPRRDPFERRLARVVSAVLDHFEAHRKLFSIVTEEESDCTRKGKQSSMRSVRERLEVLLQEGVRSGLLRREDAELFPTFLMGLLRGVFARAIQDDDHVSQDVGDALIRFFLLGAGNHKT
jgi:AcrR family transcriptional regulator